MIACLYDQWNGILCLEFQKFCQRVVKMVQKLFTDGTLQSITFPISWLADKLEILNNFFYPHTEVQVIVKRGL